WSFLTSKIELVELVITGSWWSGEFEGDEGVVKENLGNRNFKNMKKYKITPIARGNPRKGGRMGSSNFTNAESIKNNFLAHTSIRQAQKVNCQALADFANSVANINNDIQEMTLAVNEQEFNNRKQQLVSWLNGFQQQLQTQLNQLQNIQPIHQKEILQLEAEIKAAEAKYNDAMANAAKETDPAKKAQFIAIAQAAEREVKQTKQKLIRNPLSKLAEYNHLHNLGNLIKGNLPSSPTNPINCPDPSNPGSGNPRGSSGGGNGGKSGGSGQAP
ncbi:6802_t:CDS:2, partial [Ambispora leptoticha]